MWLKVTLREHLIMRCEYHGNRAKSRDVRRLVASLRRARCAPVLSWRMRTYPKFCPNAHFHSLGLSSGGTVMRFRIIAAAVVLAVSMPAGADPSLQRPVLRISQPVRIALPDFAAAGPSEIALGKSLSRIIASDLRQSGAFELVDQVAYLTKNVNIHTLPEFADWRRTSTQEFVAGRIIRQIDGRIRVEFRLWDVSSGTQLTGHQYFCSPDDLSGVGHMIAGEIYERVTNEKRTFE